MKGDRLDCPFCLYPYGEEDMEAMIYKSFKCENCDKKIVVKPAKNGTIHLEKRTSRMVYYTKMVEQEKDFNYMFSILKPCIFFAAKQYDRKIEKTFFLSGRKEWVMNARRQFCIDCDMVRIPHPTIVAFFEKNGGKMDTRTIKSYLK